MKAKEMFEKLGYSLEVNSVDLIKYSKDVCGYTLCEYDMLDTIFEKDARFSQVYLIGELKKKGYFENIKCGRNVLVKDILANCEVIQ